VIAELLKNGDLISGYRRTGGLNDLKAFGLTTLGMTTNGIALKRHLKSLHESGMDQLNISLDTLDPFQFTLMTRRNGIDKVLGSVQEALSLGFPAVKINVVVINKVNDEQILKFVELTRNLPIYVRFIEFMPFGGKWRLVEKNLDLEKPYWHNRKRLE
jgi:molybdenum cofactor biosynthesis enzyme MoaA